MRLNIKQPLSHHVSVFLNGKKVEGVIEASEEEGYVWALYLDASGKPVHKWFAEVGALIHDDLQVIKLTGDVRIELECGFFEPIEPYRLELNPQQLEKKD